MLHQLTMLFEVQLSANRDPYIGMEFFRDPRTRETFHTSQGALHNCKELACDNVQKKKFLLYMSIYNNYTDFFKIAVYRHTSCVRWLQ